MAASVGSLRLAELLGALSLATDLGNGFPFEKALRNCLLATSVGQALGLSQEELSDVYYSALLRMIGCTAFAAEEAGAFSGDDIAFRRTFAPVDFGDLEEVVAATTANHPAGPAHVERFLSSFPKPARRWRLRTATSSSGSRLDWGCKPR
jgi:hypothetical protein